MGPVVWGQSASRFPYVAYVQASEARLRSGPGPQYYSTQTLETGQAVEVYRHDPGGWLAIRPPEGAFSWIDGRYVQVDADGGGRLVADQVAVRIGSDQSDISDVIQVRLPQGERLTLLDAKELGGGASARTWYKITPPAGEFRWIRAADVSQRAPRPPENRPRENTPPRRSAPSESGVRAAVMFEDAADDAKPAATDTPDGQSAELDLLHQELVAIVAGTPETWKFERLHLGARRLLLSATNPDIRSEARLILDRIERFEEIRDRYRRLDETATADAERPSAGARESIVRDASTARPAAGASPSRKPDEVELRDPRLDGQGWLTAVASRQVGQPHFALTNASGQVRCYLTPAPGVRLNRHLGEHVGVIGTRTPAISGGVPHVIVKRIVPLDAE